MARPLNLEAFLADWPVFTLAQFAEARGDPDRPGAARNQLKRHLTRGRVKAVARELYAAVPPGLNPERFQPDPFLLAVALRPDGVFAYHSALELLGVAYSVWGEYSLHCDRRRAPLELASKRILFLTTPAELKRRGLQALATRVVPRTTRHLVVTGPERSLVEGLRQPRRVGGLEELINSVSGFRLLDFSLLQQVLEAYDERTLWSAAGWLSEAHRQTWSTPDVFLDACHQHQPRQNQYLVRGLRGGELIPEWRLIVPSHLVGGFESHASDA